MLLRQRRLEAQAARAALMAWVLATGVGAGAVTLPERPWVLQAWGNPAPVADATPTAECNPAGGSGGYIFGKTRSGGGAAELIIPSVLVPGKAYELVLPVKLVRGDGGLDVFFRRDSPYYETTSVRTVTAKAQWQTVTLRGIYDAPRVGSVRLALRNDGAAVCLGRPELREINPDGVGADDQWHPVSSHFLGIHLNKLGRHHGWPSFQPDVIRMWGTGTTWHELQPREGRIDWRGNAHGQRLDFFAAHVRERSRDAAMLMTIGMTPPWAAPPPSRMWENAPLCSTMPTASPRVKATCMPGPLSTRMPRSPRHAPLTRAASAVHLPECRSASRTSSTPTTCRPATTRRSSRARCRSSMRPASPSAAARTR